MAEETKQAISTDSLMQETRTFPPSEEVVSRAILNGDQYKEMYDRSINDSDAFWLEQAKTLTWFKEPTVARKFNWDTQAKNITHTWFEDGEINVTVNCLDRHMGTERENKAALIWQGDEIDEDRTLTYKEVYEEV
jgi:acetyl-CoA synthetase